MHLRTPAVLLLVSLALLAHRAIAQDKDTCVQAHNEAQDLPERHPPQLLRARELLRTCLSETCARVCTTPACKDMIKDCGDDLVDVNKRIPSISFSAKDLAGNDLTNVRVYVDGTLTMTRLDGSAIELDPGTHRFRFSTPGADDVDRSWTLAENNKNRSERIVFNVGVAPRPPPPVVIPLPSLGCSKDTDCKGDRVCQGGSCVEPHRRAAPPPYIPPPPPVPPPSSAARR